MSLAWLVGHVLRPGELFPAQAAAKCMVDIRECMRAGWLPADVEKLLGS